MCPFLPKECLVLFCDLILDNRSDFGQLWVWKIKHPGGMRPQTFDAFFRLHHSSRDQGRWCCEHLLCPQGSAQETQ